MNDTPPCPNATPAPEPQFTAPGVHGISSIEQRKGGTPLGCNSLHTPTAPLPTVAPHYAGLVEELKKAANESMEPVEYPLPEGGYRSGFVETEWSLLFRRSISALTQLAPLAGEVERPFKNFETFDELFAEAETHVDYWKEGCVLRGERIKELEDKLAASELDADALAEVAEVVHEFGPSLIARNYDAQSPSVCEMVAMADRALLAHRARGAAGGGQE